MLATFGSAPTHLGAHHPQPEVTVAEVLGRFAAAFPERLGPQTRRRIAAVVGGIPRPPHRRGTRPSRPDLAALAHFLAIFGDTTAEQLAPIFGRHSSTLYAMIREGRALAEAQES